MPAASGRITAAGLAPSSRNVVQGTARDLLAAAIERFEARNIPIVLTVHDEIVAEVPAELISELEFLAILLEPPQWAAGLPLAGKVWSGPHYLEPPEEAPAPAVDQREETELERLIEPHRDDDDDAVLPARTEQDDAELLTDLDDADAPLFELVSVPLTESYTTQCPFHPDEEPSLKFYADHFHCFGCGEHGDRIDWLTRGEGLSREEAIALIRDWDGPATPRRPQRRAKQDRARIAAVGSSRANRRHPGGALSRRDPPHRPRRTAGE